MKIICRNRQSGRTTEVIKKCAKYNYALIVVPTAQMANYVWKMAKEMGISIPYPITFEQFADGMFYGKNIDAFLFDDLDGSLKIMARGVSVDAVVFEKEDKQKETYK